LSRKGKLNIVKRLNDAIEVSIIRNLYVVNAAAALGEGNGPRLSRVLALPARLG